MGDQANLSKIPNSITMVMSKLERIRHLLEEGNEISWNEQSVKREHLRLEGVHYWVIGLQVSPVEPILHFEALRNFSERLTSILIPVGPMNVTKCYEYAETKRDVIKTATAYFTESIGEPGKEHGLERRIMVTMYPCQVMAENMGVRGTIDLGHYECPAPCKQAQKCSFRARSGGFFHEVSRR